jgi:hypothetical protein
MGKIFLLEKTRMVGKYSGGFERIHGKPKV